MKQLFKKLQENARSIVEIIGLVMAFLIPYIINVKGLIALCFENVSVDFDNIGSVSYTHLTLPTICSV